MMYALSNAYFEGREKEEVKKQYFGYMRSRIYEMD